MEKTYALITFLSGILTVLLGIVYLVVSHFLIKPKSANDNSNDFNTFPGELADKANNQNRTLYLSLSLAFSGFSLLTYCLTFGGLFPTSQALPSYSVIIVPVFLIILSFLGMTCMALSQIASLKSLRLMLSSSILFICCLAAIGIFPLLIVQYIFMLQPNIIICYITLVLGCICLLTLANPKLKSGFHLEKTEVNGATYWIKPKFNWLSSTIWLAYLINILMIFLFSISALLGYIGGINVPSNSIPMA